MKNTIKLGSIALALPLMLTTLGQAQLSLPQNLGGNHLNGVVFAAQIPGTNVLEVFYAGTDNGLWTRWRNPDGVWSNEVGMGGHLFRGAAPIAIRLPNTNDLEVFYRGSDDHLRARLRNQEGTWLPEQDLGGQLKSDPSAARVPGTDQIEVFYQGSDGCLKTQWGDLQSWVYERGMGGELYGGAAPIAIGLPNTNDLEVFYRGVDNHLRARLRNQEGTWLPEQDRGGQLSSDPSAAPVPGTDQIEVFYRGAGAMEGSLMTQWGDSESWVYETQVPLGGTEYVISGSTPKAYLQSGTNDLWVFYLGSQAIILAPHRTPDGSWLPSISLSYFPATSDINAVMIPGTNVMQFFYGVSKSLWTQWFSDLNP
jgi:hypothetical protein